MKKEETFGIIVFLVALVYLAVDMGWITAFQPKLLTVLALLWGLQYVLKAVK